MTAIETTTINLVAYTIEKNAIKVGEAGQQIRPESLLKCRFSSGLVPTLASLHYCFFNFIKHSHSLCYVYSGL